MDLDEIRAEIEYFEACKRSLDANTHMGILTRIMFNTLIAKGLRGYKALEGVVK